MNVTLSTGETLRYPIELRRVTQSIQTFNVRTRDVNAVLPRGMRAVDYGYGMTELYLFWLRTEDSDFGPFTEVQVSLAAQEPYHRSQSGYVFANPVTTEQARLASDEIWGVRKVVADIEIKEQGGRATCVLRIGGEFVLAMESAPLPGGPCTINAMASTAGAEGATVFRYLQKSRVCAQESRPTRARLTLGHHPLSEALRAMLIEEQASRYSYHEGSQVLMGPPLQAVYRLGTVR